MNGALSIVQKMLVCLDHLSAGSREVCGLRRYYNVGGEQESHQEACWGKEQGERRVGLMELSSTGYRSSALDFMAWHRDSWYYGSLRVAEELSCSIVGLTAQYFPYPRELHKDSLHSSGHWPLCPVAPRILWQLFWHHNSLDTSRSLVFKTKSKCYLWTISK